MKKKKIYKKIYLVVLCSWDYDYHEDAQVAYETREAAAAEVERRGGRKSGVRHEEGFKVVEIDVIPPGGDW